MVKDREPERERERERARGRSKAGWARERVVHCGIILFVSPETHNTVPYWRMYLSDLYVFTAVKLRQKLIRGENTQTTVYFLTCSTQTKFPKMFCHISFTKFQTLCSNNNNNMPSAVCEWERISAHTEDISWVSGRVLALLQECGTYHLWMWTQWSDLMWRLIHPSYVHTCTDS